MPGCPYRSEPVGDRRIIETKARCLIYANDDKREEREIDAMEDCDRESMSSQTGFFALCNSQSPREFSLRWVGRTGSPSVASRRRLPTVLHGAGRPKMGTNYVDLLKMMPNKVKMRAAPDDLIQTTSRPHDGGLAKPLPFMSQCQKASLWQLLGPGTDRIRFLAQFPIELPKSH